MVNCQEPPLLFLKTVTNTKGRSETTSSSLMDKVPWLIKTEISMMELFLRVSGTALGRCSSPQEKFVSMLAAGKMTKRRAKDPKYLKTDRLLAVSFQMI